MKIHFKANETAASGITQNVCGRKGYQTADLSRVTCGSCKRSKRWTAETEAAEPVAKPEPAADSRPELIVSAKVADAHRAESTKERNHRLLAQGRELPEWEKRAHFAAMEIRREAVERNRHQVASISKEHGNGSFDAELLTRFAPLEVEDGFRVCDERSRRYRFGTGRGCWKMELGVEDDELFLNESSVMICSGPHPDKGKTFVILRPGNQVRYRGIVYDVKSHHGRLFVKRAE